MAEIDYVVREIKLNYSGVLNLKELYGLIRAWLNEKGFFVMEKEHEGSESEEGDSIRTKFESFRKVEEYTKYFIKITIKANFLKETTEQYYYKGDFTVTFESWLEKDYENRWEENAFMKLMRGVYDKFIVNFAMGYGGRVEIIDAVRKIGEKIKEGKLDVKDINEGTFKDNLYLKDDADLIIRTGGEKRTSGFLPWQGTYAELIFLDKLWPEFEKEDFLHCIEEFKNRKRRFGK